MQNERSLLQMSQTNKRGYALHHFVQNAVKTGYGISSHFFQCCGRIASRLSIYSPSHALTRTYSFGSALVLSDGLAHVFRHGCTIIVSHTLSFARRPPGCPSLSFTPPFAPAFVAFRALFLILYLSLS